MERKEREQKQQPAAAASKSKKKPTKPQSAARAIPAVEVSSLTTKSARRRIAKKRRQVNASAAAATPLPLPLPLPSAAPSSSSSSRPSAAPAPSTVSQKASKHVTSAAASSSSEPARSCMVCGDDIDPEALFYDCERSHEHTQCLSCFADYVRHCCSHYWAGKFPLRCPVPSCRQRVDDLALRHLLAAAPEEAVITSSQPAHNSLWLLYERSQLEAALAEWALSGDDIAVTCTVCNKYAEIFPKDYQSRANRLVKAFKAWKLEKDRVQYEKEHLIPPAPPVQPGPIRVVPWREQAQAAALPLDIPPPDSLKRTISIERFHPEPEIGMTSQFFQCQTAECGASVCLRCNALVDKHDQAGHKCELDRVHELYIDVLDLLAEKSTQRCPQCNRVGRKDFNCCHITCDNPCNKRWCYVCGKVPPDDNFGPHNQWTVESAPGQHCPMYLEYKYGDKFSASGGSFSGDQALALDRFHVDIQRAALEKFRQEYKDQDLWNEMMATKFPKGIWSAEELNWFKEREAKMPEYIAERKKYREEEEKRRQEVLERQRIATEQRRREKEERQRLIIQRRPAFDRGTDKANTNIRNRSKEG